jgi:Mrp family chromosome partitioning ATPase
VSKYYDAIQRSAAGDIDSERSEPARLEQANGATFTINGSAPAVTLPTLHDLPVSVARAGGIQRLTERLAPLAVVDHAIRLLITGCRPGDGASTIAAALAVDLSQRLGLRTLLVDAHLRHPFLYRLFPPNGRGSGELRAVAQVRNRPTGWPRLDLATCWLAGEDGSGKELINEFETLADCYSATVIDLGVTRLDARMLALSRPADPILVAVRYGHSERQELATTVNALQAANRTVAGVILNATRDPVAKSVRRLLSA